MKYGLILEGGSRRCMFTAGVLDYWLENNIYFDFIAGASAGSLSAVNYVSRQAGRTRNILQPNLQDTSPKGFIRNGFADQLQRMCFDYAYEDYPFDFKTFFTSKTKCEIVVTNCITGQAEYINERVDHRKLVEALYASCSFPVIFPVAYINHTPYMDGSIGDALPFQRAFDFGCDKVIVVPTKAPNNAPFDFTKTKRIIHYKFEAQYPELYIAFMNRIDRYNAQMDAIEKYKREGKMIVIESQEPLCSSFDIDHAKLDFSYNHGRQRAIQTFDQVREFLNLDLQDKKLACQ